MTEPAIQSAPPPDSSDSEILEFLRSPGELLVVTHIFPDGDAIGSLTAFGGMLDRLGVKYTLAVDDECPDKYAFLPGFEDIRNLNRDPLDREFAKVVILDAGALARIGAANRCIGPSTRLLNIDHHFSGKLRGDLNRVWVDASATSEILFEMCRSLNIEIDTRIAYGLYTGILTDTGRFRFANTTARTMEICGELIKLGINPGMVVEKVYYNMPFDVVQALAEALGSLQLYCGGLVSLIKLDESLSVRDTEGFVEYASSIRGVALAAFICLLEPGVYKVSLRSRCEADVSETARLFGGGGHKKAAGFRWRGEAGKLQESLLAELEKVVIAHRLKPGEQFVEVLGEGVWEEADWLTAWATQRD